MVYQVLTDTPTNERGINEQRFQFPGRVGALLQGMKPLNNGSRFRDEEMEVSGLDQIGRHRQFLATGGHECFGIAPMGLGAKRDFA